jgi:hypothetical protein
VTVFALVEGHGEVDAVENLLSRLIQDLAISLPHYVTPIRTPGIANDETLERYVELVRLKPNVEALVILRDDEDGCPKTDAPRLAELIRRHGLAFPCAVVLAYREYESLFLPCIALMAGKPLVGTHGMGRPGLRAAVRHEGDAESKRGVKVAIESDGVRKDLQAHGRPVAAHPDGGLWCRTRQRAAVVSEPRTWTSVPCCEQWKQQRRLSRRVRRTRSALWFIYGAHGGEHTTPPSLPTVATSPVSSPQTSICCALLPMEHRKVDSN